MVFHVFALLCGGGACARFKKFLTLPSSSFFNFELPFVKRRIYHKKWFNEMREKGVRRICSKLPKNNVFVAMYLQRR